MIRPEKPVKLLEWGAGTNTLNQVWNELAEGDILSARRKDGVMTMVVQVKGAVDKKNPKDDAIKVAQKGEGMTSHSDSWGEVATGRLKSIEASGGMTVVQIEIANATNVGRGVD